MEPKFELNLVLKDSIKDINLKRIYKWMEEMGEDFIDRNFDVPIGDFVEWFARKYPYIKQTLKDYLGNSAVGLEGPVYFTFLDVMAYYEESPESHFNSSEPTEKFYEDFIEFINTNNELKSKLNKVLDDIDKVNKNK